MRRIVIYFGNELIPEDRIAVDIVERIKNRINGVEFYHCKSPEELAKFLNYEEVVLLDVSKDVEDVTILEDISKVKRREMVSLHDFDLNFFLKLLEKLGSLKSLKIVLIPLKLGKGIEDRIVKTLRGSNS